MTARIPRDTPLPPAVPLGSAILVSGGAIGLTAHREFRGALSELALDGLIQEPRYDGGQTVL